jgi:hypothetical protein
MSINKYILSKMHNKSSRSGFWKIKNIEKLDEQAKINYSKE